MRKKRYTGSLALPEQFFKKLLLIENPIYCIGLPNPMRGLLTLCWHSGPFYVLPCSIPSIAKHATWDLPAEFHRILVTGMSFGVQMRSTGTFAASSARGKQTLGSSLWSHCNFKQRVFFHCTLCISQPRKWLWGWRWSVRLVVTSCRSLTPGSIISLSHCLPVPALFLPGLCSLLAYWCSNTSIEL